MPRRTTPRVTRRRSSPLVADPLAALRALLQEYDRANRLAIDALYAQFSPTLDDYYAEELAIVFPTEQRAPDQAADGVRPDLLLTRTVPGLEPRSVRAQGAPFPLARAHALVIEALAAAPSRESDEVLARLEGGRAFLRPAQSGRTQLVQLLLEPGAKDIIALLTTG